MDVTWAEIEEWEAAAARKATTIERARCLRIIQRLREQGDADLRDARDWIEAGTDVDGEE
jgi:hypothetical protein